jgi:hypothetical protein
MAIGRLTQGRWELMPATVGQPYIYDHPDNKGYGEHAKGDVLTAEMAELDLKDGTPVFVIELDAESGWPLVDWTDSTGIYRITTIDPALFDDLFVPGTRKARTLCRSSQLASLCNMRSSRP